MSSLNQVTLIGNLGADPEVRHTNNGDAVCSLRIATTDTWHDKAGKKQERTEWHRVNVWGPPAENCGKYLAKGRMVAVTGKLQTREYEDKDKTKRFVTEIRADRVVFLPDGGSRRKVEDPETLAGKADDLPF